MLEQFYAVPEHANFPHFPGRFMEKASRNASLLNDSYAMTFGLTDHEYCGDMLHALKTSNCSLLQTNFSNKSDCIGEEVQRVMSLIFFAHL